MFGAIAVAAVFVPAIVVAYKGDSFVYVLAKYKSLLYLVYLGHSVELPQCLIYQTFHRQLLLFLKIR